MLNMQTFSYFLTYQHTPALCQKGKTHLTSTGGTLNTCTKSCDAPLPFRCAYAPFMMWSIQWRLEGNWEGQGGEKHKNRHNQCTLVCSVTKVFVQFSACTTCCLESSDFFRLDEKYKRDKRNGIIKAEYWTSHAYKSTTQNKIYS